MPQQGQVRRKRQLEHLRDDAVGEAVSLPPVVVVVADGGNATPPGSEPTTWSLCYIPNKGQKNGYGCTGTAVYREKGVYERDISMTSFWENESIIWTEGIKQMDLVIKDNSGGGGHAHKRSDHEKFFPTKVRITMVQVSAGAKYDPALVPNLPK